MSAKGSMGHSDSRPTKSRKGFRRLKNKSSADSSRGQSTTDTPEVTDASARQLPSSEATENKQSTMSAQLRNTSLKITEFSAGNQPKPLSISAKKSIDCEIAKHPPSAERVNALTQRSLSQYPVQQSELQTKPQSEQEQESESDSTLRECCSPSSKSTGAETETETGPSFKLIRRSRHGTVSQVRAIAIKDPVSFSTSHTVPTCPCTRNEKLNFLRSSMPARYFRARGLSSYAKKHYLNIPKLFLELPSYQEEWEYHFYNAYRVCEDLTVVRDMLRSHAQLYGFAGINGTVGSEQDIQDAQELLQRQKAMQHMITCERLSRVWRSPLGALLQHQWN